MQFNRRDSRVDHYSSSRLKLTKPSAVSHRMISVQKTQLGIERTKEGQPALLEFITEKAVDFSMF